MKFHFAMIPLVSLLVSSPVMAADDHSEGEAVYEKWCFQCHGPEKWEHSGTMALLAKYQDSLPADLLERKDLTEETISFYIRNGISVMPFFRKTEISDEQLKQLTRFIVDTARR